jgi:peptidoglycan hydrolase CwlO-like protein
MMKNLKLILIWTLSLVALASIIFVLSPLFSKKVETIRNPQIDSLGAVISEIKARNEELSKQIIYLDGQLTENYAKLQNDLNKIKRFTPVSRAKYLDSLFTVNNVK